MISVVKNSNFDFMRLSKAAIIFSSALLVISFLSLSLRGLNFGIDFTGGTLVEVGYDKSIALDEARKTLEKEGFANAKVQYFGSANELLLRLPVTANAAETSSQVVAALKTLGRATIRRIEYVGPKVGAELRESGGLALLYALLGILVYVAFRFEYRFAFGAVIAVVHDVILTVGFFSIVGIESDLTVLAALLAVVGYSLNDTIVVYDRVRENFRGSRLLETATIINKSINQILGRTVVTSLTTLLVLAALLVFGGEAVRGFTVAMIVGVVVGTYSSVYIAGACLVLFGVTQKDMSPVEKEGKEFGSS